MAYQLISIEKAPFFLHAASKYGELVRLPDQESDDLICQEICPGCRGKLRWHMWSNFLICDTCDRWFFVVDVYGSWEVIRDKQRSEAGR